MWSHEDCCSIVVSPAILRSNMLAFFNGFFSVQLWPPRYSWFIFFCVLHTSYCSFVVFCLMFILIFCAFC